MNRLTDEKSAYLRHAANQGIDWYPWGEEAFDRAKKEDKPVFLSTGAIWCHWCHVMAKECFEDKDIAGLLNDNFINIKLDRDERPDIDRRYQKAVSAMGYGGGWPLSVFLTPDKKPFFGGTYFPPEDIQGRPGFKNVLKQVAAFFRSNRNNISEFTAKLLDHLKQDPHQAGEIGPQLIEKAAEDIFSEFDPQNGGFGTSPKFPMPGATGFLLSRYFFTRKESFGYAAKKTLEAMAKGGFHDQLGGGFHRYSVDEAWIVPHFEKMADDNAWLLRNYLDAYLLFGDERFRTVAEDIICFIGSVLSDPEGGFFASQDADVTPDDEGGYFTWTENDLRRELTPEEYMVLSLHLFHAKGVMHHDKSKRVLFVAMDAGETSKKVSMGIEQVTDLIGSGKAKLLRERTNRKAPFIDRTLYTSLNSMLITSYLLAFRTLGHKWAKDFALNTLKKIMQRRFKDNVLFHSEGVKAVLDDYIFLTEALISAYEVTAKPSYLDNAERLMKLCIEKLWDEKEGGFFDSEDALLGIRLKAIEDIPHPSPNAVGIILLLKLYFMIGKPGYRELAEKALKYFSGSAGEMGIHAGCYYLALDAYYNMIKLSVNASPGSELAKTGLSTFRPYIAFAYGEDEGHVQPCTFGSCFGPVTKADELRSFVATPQT